MEKDPSLLGDPREPVEFEPYYAYRSIGPNADKDPVRLVEITTIQALEFAIYGVGSLKTGDMDGFPFELIPAIALVDKRAAKLLTDYFTSNAKNHNQAAKMGYKTKRVLHFLHLADEPSAPELLPTQPPTPVAFKLKHSQSH